MLLRKSLVAKEVIGFYGSHCYLRKYAVAKEKSGAKIVIGFYGSHW